MIKRNHRLAVLSFAVVLDLLLSYPLLAESASFVRRPIDKKGSVGMTYLQASVLGLVEGLTEYLPVSSTGHLVIAERLMGINSDEGTDPASPRKEAADAYAICIQAGAIVAVLGLYFRRVKQMFLGFVGKDPAGLRLAVNLIAAFLPAAILGLLFHRIIKEYLFGPWPIVIAWLAGGVGILIMTRRSGSLSQGARNTKTLTDLNIRMALIIGLAQCLAMWPGVSRSLATILGGLLVGLPTAVAVEFSFLLGVITLGAATTFDALKHGSEMLASFDALSLLLGLVVAFGAAVASVKWMVTYLNHHGLEVFGYYRIGIAILATGLILIGVL